MTTPTPHGRARYTKGCRCGQCRAANREYQRQYRSTKPVRALPDPPPSRQAADDTAPAAAGPVAAAVAAQLAGLPAAVERPALAAIAQVLAEGLDRDDAVPQRAALAHRLTEVLDTLAKSSTQRHRLSLVRSMTAGDPGKGSTSRAKSRRATGPAL